MKRHIRILVFALCGSLLLGCSAGAQGAEERDEQEAAAKEDQSSSSEESSNTGHYGRTFRYAWAVPLSFLSPPVFKAGS